MIVIAGSAANTYVRVTAKALRDEIMSFP